MVLLVVTEPVAVANVLALDSPGLVAVELVPRSDMSPTGMSSPVEKPSLGLTADIVSLYQVEATRRCDQ